MTPEAAKARIIANHPEKAERINRLGDRDPKVWWADMVDVKGYPKSQAAWDRIHDGAAMAALRAKGCNVFKKGERNLRIGTPDGWTKQEATAARKLGQDEATGIIETMIAKDILAPDEDLANEALAYFVGVLRSARDGTAPYSAKDVAHAAGMILNYTKGKPAAKIEASVSKAEDFLAALLPSM